MKLTKVRTILFTEACPLACRYCYLKDDDAFGEFPALTHEQFIDTVALYDKTDNPDCFSNASFVALMTHLPISSPSFECLPPSVSFNLLFILHTIEIISVPVPVAIP